MEFYNKTQRDVEKKKRWQIKKMSTQKRKSKNKNTQSQRIMHYDCVFIAKETVFTYRVKQTWINLKEC